MVHGWTSLKSSVDNIFLLITAISLVILLGVTGVMIWFSIRYNRKRHPRAECHANMLLSLQNTALLAFQYGQIVSTHFFTTLWDVERSL